MDNFVYCQTIAQMITHTLQVIVRGADLIVADLGGADLDGADLSEAKLNGAKVPPEQLAKAKLLTGAIMPDWSKHP